MSGLKHSYLMGVCDPTGMLPEGSVFIPGYCSNEKEERVLFSSHLERIFVTRSPCKDPTDGKLLPLVGTKPEEMPRDVWEWLCKKPFGTIIFSRQKDRINATPLPALCGEGDLDGDMYFVLFDKCLIKELEPCFDGAKMQWEIKKQENELRKQQINLKEGPKFKADISKDVNWFAAAQKEILNIEYQSNVGKVIGSMWNLSEQLAKENPEEGIWDPDARACAIASRNAIDTLKHGIGVELPSRLKTKVKEKLHTYISWT